MKTENRIDHYIDLHAHLDGCITTEIARKLAALQQITLPAATDEELLSLLSVPDTCENLNDFLKCFDLPLSLLQTEEALEEAVYLILSEMKEDGVIYAELRFAPQLHTQKEMTQETAIHAALRGLKIHSRIAITAISTHVCFAVRLPAVSAFSCTSGSLVSVFSSKAASSGRIPNSSRSINRLAVPGSAFPVSLN